MDTPLITEQEISNVIATYRNHSSQSCPPTQDRHTDEVPTKKGIRSYHKYVFLTNGQILAYKLSSDSDISTIFYCKYDKFVDVDMK